MCSCGYAGRYPNEHVLLGSCWPLIFFIKPRRGLTSSKCPSFLLKSKNKIVLWGVEFGFYILERPPNFLLAWDLKIWPPQVLWDPPPTLGLAHPNLCFEAPVKTKRKYGTSSDFQCRGRVDAMPSQLKLNSKNARLMSSHLKLAN